MSSGEHSQVTHAIVFARNADSELDKTSVTALHESAGNVNILPRRSANQ
jgi:hypothetical protein